MQTYKEILEDLTSYAESLELSGVAVEKLCSLAAYSIYKNQILQTADALEYSFSTSQKLNSRIHHAANLMYSVPRGKCPMLKLSTLKSTETKSVDYLDFAMLFNGYYFYFTEKQNYQATEGVTMSELQLIASSKATQETTVNTSSKKFYVDFIEAENVSSDYILYDESSTVIDKSRITEDTSQFYYKQKVKIDTTYTYQYQYDYLVLTIPNYGVRVVRHSDTSDWGTQRLTLKYLPYCETLPTLTALTSVPGFSFVYDEATSTYTQITTIPFEARLEDLNQIYMNASASFLQQSTLATTDDLEIAMKKADPNGSYHIVNDKKITWSKEKGYEVSVESAYTTVVYNGVEEASDLTAAIEVFKKGLNVTNEIGIVEATPYDTVKVWVSAQSSTMTLTNDMLNSMTNGYKEQIGSSIDHSDFEADIIRLGFDSVKVYTSDDKTTESSFSIKCLDYQYPYIEAKVV